MDFRHPTIIANRLDSDYCAIKNAGGYDSFYILSHKVKDSLYLAAKICSPFNGLKLTCKTTQSGLQFYSGNWLNGNVSGKGGISYPRHYGLCLETQNYPDALSIPKFPNALLKPGETYWQKTIYALSTK